MQTFMFKNEHFNNIYIIKQKTINNLDVPFEDWLMNMSIWWHYATIKKINLLNDLQDY